MQPLAKWVREVGTEPTGGVVLPSSEVDVLRTLIARSGDWSALAEHRAELRVEVVALLGCSLGVEEK